MNVKALIGSAAATGLLGLGILAGGVIGSGNASAQTQGSSPAASYYSVAAQVAAATAQPTVVQPGSSTTKATITQAQAEQAALAASPGNTIDHSSLGDQNGVAIYDVDFANGGGVIINAETGAVITVEAAGADKGGGRGGHGGGADQAALAAKATVSQADAEKAALAASPGNTVDHSRLGDNNGTIYWDIDFANGGGVEVNALTGAVITVEAAGTDSGHMGGPAQTQP